MAAEDGNITRYTYRGEVHERIPREATHITVAEDVTFVRAWALAGHRNIIEVICHDRVDKIGDQAFWCCPNLRRVIIPGVKIAAHRAFHCCKALTDIECGKLEIIGQSAFKLCESLESISLPSARIVDVNAFSHSALTGVKFSNKLERIGSLAFIDCPSLERITLPLKDGLITADNIFMGCDKLTRVDLVEEAALQETAAALQLDVWENDMNEEIDSINRILLNARAGCVTGGWFDDGEKAQAIRRWIESFIGKINRYKAEHRRVLNEAAATLQLVLPPDIATKNIVPFLELPGLDLLRLSSAWGRA